ncbi:hypothetical protein [Zavarzinia sp. CC-PAN008]|uniref:hypothetical protein n=1 Tax=Zavarzinia sp. CC-PAN008 TaxID=3243332 RepID=UPI003F7489B1
MLFHISICAADPERAARVIAELWQGTVMPFPPHAGSFIALAGDDRGTAIEVFPLGSEMVPAPGEDEVLFHINAAASRFTATHAAIATPLDTDAVRAIAKREGWMAKVCKRGDAFGVIELWIDNATLVEVLTPQMQAEYLATMSPAGWAQAFDAPRAAA